MAPIGLKAVVGESKIIFVLFYSKSGGMRRCALARKYGCFCVILRDFACQLVHLGDDVDDDDDEGGAVGVPLYPIVNRSRVVREL